VRPSPRDHERVVPAEPRVGLRLAGAVGDGVLVVGGGLIYAAAQPPRDWAVLAWVALVPLVLVAGRRTRGGAFVAGAVYGTVFFAAIVPWVVGAVRAYFETSFVAALAFGGAVCLLYVAVYIGLFAVAVREILARSRWLALLALPALWVGCELARARLLTGLPWGFLGHSQWTVPTLIQVADLGGAYLVSFVIAAVNVGIALALRDAATRGRLAAVRPLAVALAAVAVVAVYGTARLRQIAASETATRAETVTLVQGKSVLATTWLRAASERALQLYSDLTRRAVAAGPALVVWPEYAVPLYPETDARMAAVLRGLAAATPAGLVFGAPRLVGGRDGEQYRNAAYHLSPAGALDAYEKRRLVPFAEYQPLPLGPAIADADDRRFSAGKPAKPFATGVGRLGMLICYEVIYPSMVRDLVRAGAEVLVNVANDGWLDVSHLGATEQHLAIAVFRAVETRRYLVRAAATGISGFVDPTGRPYALLAAGMRGVTSGAIRPRRDVTVYTRAGDAFAIVGTLLGLAVLGWCAREPGAA
jgi:apolipoprotein N-acyltransferase